MSNLIKVGANPSNPLRTAWVSLLSDIGIPVFDTVVPESSPTPSFYVIVEDFTKTLNETCKDANGWDCTVLVNICQFQPQGYLSHDDVDSMEETILNKVALLNQFEVTGFTVDDTSFQDSRSLDVVQPPGGVSGRNLVRTVLTYQHTLYAQN